MIKILVTCHVEPLRETADITYLKLFFKRVQEAQISAVFLLQVGETAGDSILRFVRNNPQVIPKNCSIGLHVHGGETERTILLYKKIMGEYPETISFGHWSYTNKDLQTAAKYRVKADHSYSAYRHNERYFLKSPFKIFDLTEYPVACDPLFPINPLSSWYHQLLSLSLFLLLLTSDQLLHLSFHSYDTVDHPVKSYFALKLLSLFKRPLL